MFAQVSLVACRMQNSTCVAAHGPQRTEGLAGQLLRTVILAALALLGGGPLGMAGERVGMMGGRGGSVQKGTLAPRHEAPAVAVVVAAAGDTGWE
jgi:hypothetical protein